MSEIKSLPRTMYAPFDPDVDTYFYSRTTLEHGSVLPLEYSGWRNEVMSWKETCYLHSGLNPAFTYRVKGPAIRATVARFPYLNANRNEQIDVHAIPCKYRGLLAPTYDPLP